MRQREAIAGYLFVLPDALGLMLFVGAPMVLALVISLFDVNGFGRYAFVGLGNYVRLWGDPLFWSSLRVTVTFCIILVPLLYVSGLGLALLIQRSSRINAVLRAMFFAPQMVSLVVVGLVWQLMSADKVGVIARTLQAVGLDGISLLGDPNIALLTIAGAMVWFLMGFYMLIFLGGLEDIPKDLYEAASIDGATRIQRFFYITLPMLRPTSFFVLIVAVVAAVAGAQAFDLVFVMTKGGPSNSTTLLVSYIYQQAFLYSSFGYAAAMATLLVALVLVITVLFFQLTRGGRFDYD